MNKEVFRLKAYSEELQPTNKPARAKRKIPEESLNKLKRLNDVKYRRELSRNFVFSPAAGASLKKIAGHFETVPIKQYIAVRFVHLLEVFGLGTKKEHQEGFYEPILEALYELLIHEYGTEFNVYDLAFLFDAIQARRVKLPGGGHLEMPDIYGKLSLDVLADSASVYLQARKERLKAWRPKRERFLRELPQKFQALSGAQKDQALKQLQSNGDKEALALIKPLTENLLTYGKEE